MKLSTFVVALVVVVLASRWLVRRLRALQSDVASAEFRGLP